MRLLGDWMFGAVLIGGLGVCVWQREAKNGEALRMDSCAAKRRFSGPTWSVIIVALGGDGLLASIDPLVSLGLGGHA